MGLARKILEHVDVEESFTSQRDRFVASGADPKKVAAVFADFRKLKARGILKGSEKDIDRYGTFDEVEGLVSSKSGEKTKSAEKKAVKRAGSDLVYEDDDYAVYWIKSPGASCQYGSGTKWCITGDKAEQFFRQYTEIGGDTIYMAVPKRGDLEKYALITGSGDPDDPNLDYEDNPDTIRVRNAKDDLVDPPPAELAGVLGSGRITQRDTPRQYGFDGWDTADMGAGNWGYGRELPDGSNMIVSDGNGWLIRPGAPVSISIWPGKYWDDEVPKGQGSAAQVSLKKAMALDKKLLGAESKAEAEKILADSGARVSRWP